MASEDIEDARDSVQKKIDKFDFSKVQPMLREMIAHAIPLIYEARRQSDSELESWGYQPVGGDIDKLYELASLTGRNANPMTYGEVVDWAVELKREATIRRQVETDSSTNQLRSIPTAPNTKLLEFHGNKESVSGETPSQSMGDATSQESIEPNPDHWVSIREIHLNFRDRNNRKPSKASLRRWLTNEGLKQNPHATIAEYWLPDVQAMLVKKHFRNKDQTEPN
ncbi:MAG: hypothetical protein K9M08_12405 [Pirellula sp.]|nr:hypothetical protein [Pirellula sp.]